MPQSRAGFKVAMIAFLAARVLSGTAAAAPPEPAGLAGKWTRNRELSQDLAAHIEESAGAAHMSGGPGWATETWLPWGADFGEPERLGVREFLLATVPAFDLLEIQVGGDEVTTIHGKSGSRLFRLKRASAGTSPMGGETVSRQARLEDRRLVLDTKGKDGRFHEELTLEPSGDRLVYVLRLEQKRLDKPLAVRLVYDRAQ